MLQFLEFHWNFTYIGTMLPRWWTNNIYYILSGSMEIITWMVIKSIQGSLYLSLHIYVMVVIKIACCVPWTTCFKMPMGYTKRIHRKTPSLNMYTNCIHTFSPPLSKYGVYNFSMCHAHNLNTVRRTDINSLCGFVPHLYAVDSPTKWVRRIYTCIPIVHPAHSYRHLVPCAH